jgi:hypothetical protein
VCLVFPKRAQTVPIGTPHARRAAGSSAVSRESRRGSVCGAMSADGATFAMANGEAVLDMAHRVVEMLIGRLLTDEGFRRDFLREPQAVLRDLRDRGLELTQTEMSALARTDPAVWTMAADGLDRRLQKAGVRDDGVR